MTNRFVICYSWGFQTTKRRIFTPEQTEFTPRRRRMRDINKTETVRDRSVKLLQIWMSHPQHGDLRSIVSIVAVGVNKVLWVSCFRLLEFWRSLFLKRRLTKYIIGNWSNCFHCVVSSGYQFVLVMEHMHAQRGKRALKRYLTDTDSTVPRTTLWRKKRRILSR